MRTKVFKSGNSLVVRIPKESGFVDAAQDVDLERVGNPLAMQSVERETLADLGEILAMFSPDFMADGREFYPEEERNWNVAPNENERKR